jgi:hypothetical protein
MRTCEIEKCERKYAAKGGCRNHYIQLRDAGITAEEYNKLLLNQGHACAICRTLEPRGQGTWHIDRDRDTGRTRGLLCNGCNVGTGMLGDNPDTLIAAVAYLLQFSDTLSQPTTREVTHE